MGSHFKLCTKILLTSIQCKHINILKLPNLLLAVSRQIYKGAFLEERLKTFLFGFAGIFFPPP